MKKSKYGYMCGVDYQHELGEVPDFSLIYSSVKDLKRQRECWKGCGIVKLKIDLVKWSEPQRLMKDDKTRK